MRVLFSNLFILCYNIEKENDVKKKLKMLVIIL